MDELSLHVGARNGDAKRTVTAILRGAELHRDRFDTDDAFKRKRFVDDTSAKLKAEGVFEDCGYIEPWIVTQAQASDVAGGSDREAFRLVGMTTRELIDTARPHEYLIPGLLAKGQHGTITGFKKSMKTSIGADLAISLACGGRFLGYFPAAVRSKVGFLSAESGQQTIAETTRRIADAAGVDPRSALENIIWSMRVPRLMDPLHRDELRRFIGEHRLDVLLVDPFYLAMAGIGGDAANLFAMAEVLGPLGEMCSDAGCTPIIVHHTSNRGARQRGFEPAELEDISYAGVAEWVRQWVLLSRRSAYVKGSGRQELWLSFGGSAGHSGLVEVDIEEGVFDPDRPRVWRSCVRNASEGQQLAAETRQRQVDERLDSHKREIVKAMLALDGHRGTKTEIRTASELNGQSFQRAFGALIKEKTVATAEIVKEGSKRTWSGYRLKEDEDCK
jgi:AAA domain